MSDITPADALRELRDGDYPDYIAAAKKAEPPDSRPLPEDVTGHTLMGPARSHADGRICMYHHRLDAWTWDFVNECLRDHGDPL